MKSSTHLPGAAVPAAAAAAATPQADFDAGFAAHRAGQLGPALACYDKVLQQQPGHFDALHLKGVVLRQLKQARQALEWLDRAIAVRPDNPFVYGNRSVALYDVGAYQDAVDSCDRAIALKPDFADAYFNRGNALQAIGRSPAAIDSYDTALRLQPGHLGACKNRGNALAALGRHAEAIDSYQRALEIEPTLVDIHCNIGSAWREQGQHEQAMASYERAIALNPHYAQAHYNRGNLLRQLGRIDEAIGSYEQALQANPRYAEAHSNLGVLLGNRGQRSAAIACFDQAIALQPDYAEARNNRAALFNALGRYDEALADYDIATAIHPGYVEAFCNRGVTLKNMLQHQRALDSYAAALALEPGRAEAHWNRALCLLQMGNYAEGWSAFEWRWRNEGLDVYKQKRELAQPLWLGQQPLAGKTILLHAEQGFGDTIQFCRYASLVRQRGARVILEVPFPLLRLLTTLDGVDLLCVQGSTLPPFDYHVPLMSLPLCFNTTLATIPAAPAYLRADPALVQQWEQQLGPRSRPRVGIVWSGNAGHTNDTHRSFSLADFLRHLPPECDYVSLQKEVRQRDLDTIAATPQLRHVGADLHDFADTAALASLMDLVVSVDTSVAHLVAAIGRPVWILLPHNPDWRWLLERTDTPWYPSARLFRQPASGDWDSLMQALGAALQDHCAPLPAAQLFTRAFAQHQGGQLVLARAGYQQLLARQPDHADAHHMLAVLQVQSGQPQAALEGFAQALAGQPDNAAIYNNRSVARFRLGQAGAAQADAERALALLPDYADAHVNLGNALMQAGRFDAARDSFLAALALAPGDARALAACATAYCGLQQFDAAAASAAAAVALRPEAVDAHLALAIALLMQGQHGAAQDSLDRVLALAPAHADAHYYSGNAWRERSAPQLALACYQRAIALAPGHADAHYNCAATLCDLGQGEAALPHYAQAIALRPSDAAAYWGRSLCLLALGRFDEGWADYEWRWRYPYAGLTPRQFDAPLWLGQQALAGQTILLHAEQGFGDTLQFCRYARLVKQLGAQVVLEVQAPLHALLQGLDGVDQLVCAGQPLPPFDVHTPLLSLPLALGTTLATIPAPVPYLQADGARLAHWAAWLGPATMPRIGIAWSGRAGHSNDQQRSIALAELVRHLPPGCQYVSLQTEVRAHDAAALAASAIVHPGAALGDFSDSAALCTLMDLVVCVDTSVAHLAGALGKPALVLLPANADWRWLQGRSDSPWYPSLQLLRQENFGDWETTWARLPGAIAALLAR